MILRYCLLYRVAAFVALPRPSAPRFSRSQCFLLMLLPRMPEVNETTNEVLKRAARPHQRRLCCSSCADLQHTKMRGLMMSNNSCCLPSCKSPPGGRTMASRLEASRETKMSGTKGMTCRSQMPGLEGRPSGESLITRTSGGLSEDPSASGSMTCTLPPSSTTTIQLSFVGFAAQLESFEAWCSASACDLLSSR